MKKNKTAVQWLLKEILSVDWNHLQGSKKLEIFEQAKQMEKEQIMAAWVDSLGSDIKFMTYAEQYYNETYNQ